MDGSQMRGLIFCIISPWGIWPMAILIVLVSSISNAELFVLETFG